MSSAEELVAEFERLPSGIHTALPGGERAADYDRIAKGYDALVGNAIYNRIVWGVCKSAYADAARALIAKAGSGSLIDFGCGSLVFTAEEYRGHENELVLMDRSLGMLERGQQRLPQGRFLQADAFDPPFAPRTFSAGMAWGMLHLFGTGSDYFGNFARALAPGAPAALCTLVLTARSFGNRMLVMLHKRGEAAPPEPADAVVRAAEDYFDDIQSDLRGSMLFLSGRRKAV